MKNGRRLTDGLFQGLSSLVADYEKMMDEYDVTKAARAVSDFTIDHLSNWYVRRCQKKVLEI